MVPGQWQRIKDLFEAALELSPLKRTEFLQEECGGDDQLRFEVEALLKESSRVGSFLKQPLFGSLVSHAFPTQRNELLGDFRIVDLIGTGGMGRVYKAYQISAQREVALKILNADFALEQDDVSRFEREAWIGGRLDHPNIVKAYGQGEVLGLRYISMELLEGPSLATDILITRAEWEQENDTAVRTDRVDRMIRLFSSVADALHYVHENAIIHRDIKPQNLLLTDGGSKMLVSDFGVARDEALTQLTRHGDFFGTIRYMSPEQMLGRRSKVDRRTDIWSLGASLYEAVTLDLPYTAETEQGYLAAVGMSEPLPARARRQFVPKDLETVLMKCLEKESASRYRTAAELRDDLRRLAEQRPILAKRPSFLMKLSRMTKQHRRTILTFAAACVVLAAVLASAYVLRMKIGERAPFSIRPFTTLPGGEYEPKFSPDEKRVAFVWNHENESTFNVYIQNIDRSGLRRITSDNASEGSPAWSPDGDSIAFIRQTGRDSGVYIQPLSGGSERKVTSIVPLEHAFQRRLDWSPDGKYLVLADAAGDGQPMAIFLVSPQDGTRSRLTTPITGTQGDTAPAFSADGKTITFLRFAGSDVDDLYQLPVMGGKATRLTSDNSFISDYAWMANRRELAVNSKRSGSLELWVMPVRGGSPKLVNGSASGAYFIDVAPKTNLLALSVWTADTNIWRVDVVPGHPEKSKFTEIIASTMDDRSGQFSPDGTRVVYRSNQSGADELWLADSSGKNESQLTFFDGPLTGTPRWSPDETQIAFDSRPTGRSNVFVISAQGGEPRRVTSGPGDNLVPSWSCDGKWIYFGSNRLGNFDVWKVPAEGESASSPAIRVTVNGGFSSFESPDGQWIYYSRNSGGLWRHPVGGGRETLVTPELQMGFWGYWTVGRDAIYFIRCDAQNHCAIKSFSLEAGRSSTLALLPKEPPFSDSGLSATNGGKSFLYPEVDHSQSNILLGSNFR